METKISVALCTYNGEQFLKEQLDSIVQQTVLVDEIVICDDGSTDGTIQLIENYQKSCPITLHYFQNKTNLGSTKNFEQCVKFCKGNYIFFADQDDLWKKEKVATIMSLFEQNKEWKAVFSNAQIINQAGQPTGKTSFEEIEFTDELQTKWRSGNAFDILLKGYVVTGATLAIKREIIEKVFPTPNLIKELIHDGWIALYLSVFNQIGFTNTCLILYRTHASQQVGFGKKGKKITLLDRIKRDRIEKLARIEPHVKNSAALADYFATLEGIPVQILDLLKERKEHFAFRYHLSSNRLFRIIPIIGHVLSGTYARQEVGKWWHTVLGDLFE